ncbi:hypothetical protein [Nonomuraea dietziae]|uniref:hypothetical protein n=1 Tax=Nonomuraea dietziae TaxID=65515 RepID=UPI0034432509
MFFAAIDSERYWLHEVRIPAPIAAALAKMTVWVLRHDTDARTTGEVGVYGSR